MGRRMSNGGVWEMLREMSPAERNAFLDRNPEIKVLLQAAARQQAGTDVDATGDRLAGILQNLGVSPETRNELLARHVAAAQKAFPNFGDQSVPLHDRMRIMDLAWVGALVHEFFNQLFPKEGS